MDRLRTIYLRSLLRRRLAWFLECRSPWRSPLVSALRGLGHEVPIYLFGGAVRDLAIFGRNASPIDIDLVVGGVSVGELESILSAFVERRTRLGGLKLTIEGTAVDIWPLHETWAFRVNRMASPTFAELPATTFLNVEAVAAELTCACRRIGRIYSKGFFESVCSREIDLNYAANPYPEKAVARSLTLASRIGFSVGPALAGRAAELLASARMKDQDDDPALSLATPLARR